METKQKSGLFRKRRISFAQVSSVALLDNTLSSKAKGLYSLIQYFINIPEFKLYKNTLKKHMVEGDKAFENMWKELKDKGYLIQYRLQGDRGYYYYEYELLDEPNLKLANEIHSSQNRKKSEEKNHTPKTEGMDKKSPKNHTPKMEGMDNGSDGKVGVYNNNNLNNNNLNNIKITTTKEKDNNKNSSSIKINLDIKGITKTNIKRLNLNQEQINLLENYIAISEYENLDKFCYYIAKQIKNKLITEKDLSISKKIGKKKKGTGLSSYFEKDKEYYKKIAEEENQRFFDEPLTLDN